ncbi:MAG: hypothetical protein ORN57_03380 [Alphaproteobacteria bacterium]|nr:hypothetical protein [Alphaproteobacteria bacterium]
MTKSKTKEIVYDIAKLLPPLLWLFMEVRKEFGQNKKGGWFSKKGADDGIIKLLMGREDYEAMQKIVEKQEKRLQQLEKSVDQYVSKLKKS